MYPENYRYSEEHEWFNVDGDECIVGITHFAQDELGEVVFVELPEVGATTEAGTPFQFTVTTWITDDGFSIFDSWCAPIRMPVPKTVTASAATSKMRTDLCMGKISPSGNL